MRSHIVFTFWFSLCFCGVAAATNPTHDLRLVVTNLTGTSITYSVRINTVPPTTPSNFKSARFVVAFNRNQLIFDRAEIGVGTTRFPGSMWAALEPMLRHGTGNIDNVVVLVRETTALANVMIGNDPDNPFEIARLFFRRTGVSEISPFLTSSVVLVNNDQKTSLVILKPGPVDVFPPELRVGTPIPDVRIADFRNEGEYVSFPILIHSSQEIREATLTFDYDQNVTAFADPARADILLGKGLQGKNFNITTNLTPSTPPAAWANRNFSLVLRSPAGQSFSGQDVEIVVVRFKWRYRGRTPALGLNTDCSMGFLQVVNELGQTQKRCLTPDSLATEVAEHATASLPEAFDLLPGFPNPALMNGFHAGTTIRFALPKAEHVTIRVYDILGRQVKTLFEGQSSAGWHNLFWRGDHNAGQFASVGIYFVHMQAGDFHKTRRILILK